MSLSERSNTPHIAVQLPSVYESVETPLSGTPRAPKQSQGADADAGGRVGTGSTVNGDEAAPNSIDIPWVSNYCICFTVPLKADNYIYIYDNRWFDPKKL